MANSNQVELVVTVEVDKANQSIKSVNANLSGIEQTAVRAASGASQGIDGMTASMIKGATAGNLLADAIKKAIDWAKEWTVEAAKEAAHTERAAVVARSLAKAHGDGAAAAEKAIEAIKQVGYATADATAVVQKLIIADIGLDKASSLAKIAKDAAAVSTEGIGAADAFEKIMMAIETGQSRGLRTLNLFPDLAKAEQVATLQAQLHGRMLSELEIKQVRYNAIVEAAIAIQGSAAAQAGTFDGQMKKLDREMKDLKDDVGKAFQGELMMAVGILKTMVGFFKDHTDGIEKFGKGVLVLVGIIATITAATKAWALAQGALNLAMAINPAFLLAGGIIGAGAIIWKEYSEMQEGWDRRTKEMQDAALRKDVFSGKVKIDDLKKRGMSEEDIQALISGRRAIPAMGDEGGGFDLSGLGLPKIKIKGAGPTPEELKLQVEIQKRQRENEKYFRDQAIGSRGSMITVGGKQMEVPLTGYAKDVAEINKEITSKTTYVDDMGEHHVPMTKKAWASVIEFASNKFKAFLGKTADDNRKAIADYLKDEDEKHQKTMEYEARRFQERLKNDTEIAERNLDHLRDVYAFEEQRAGFERDAKLRRLDGMDAQTIQDKVAVEQQKAQIEIEYLQKVHLVKQAIYDMDTHRMVLEETLTLTRLKYKADEIRARIAELEGQRKEIRDQSDEANDAAIQAARENASNRTAQMVREHNRSIFDSLKQQAGGVFDALLQKSQSIWQAIGSSLKTAILTAIKDIVTSRVAALLMSLLYGTRVSFAGGGGIAGTPTFSGAGGGAGAGLGLLSLLRGGGGGQVVAGGGGAPAQVAAGGGGVSLGGFGIPGLGGGTTGGSLKSMPATMWQNLKGFAGFGNVATDSQGGKWVTIGNQSVSIDSLGGKLTAVGRSPAAGMAGMGAFMYGLSNRSAKGDAALIGGGALAGYQMGGPWGAAGGAIAGGMIAGLRRGGFVGWAETGFNPIAGLFILFGGSKLLQGAQEKVRQKIKELYGVDITDKKVLQQIVDIAKQSYGSNIDMAIRTQQVRDLIQLFAMSTGQTTKGMPATVHSLDIVQSGGSLYQSPGYSNGSALPGLGGIPTLDSIGGGVATNAQPMVIQLDGPATTSLLQGQAVQAIASNPRVVQSAVMSASKSNAGRRELTSLQLSPGLVTS